MKILLIISALISSPFLPAQSEINNKTIISNMFNACVDQDEYPNGIGYQYSYCGCFINKVSNGMNTKELVEFNLTMESKRKPEQQQKTLLANKKIKNYIVDCVSSTFEE